MSARFSELDVNARLKDRRRLSAYLDSIISSRKKDIKEISLQYVFCTDDYLLQMNQQFLAHDTLTDIITFDLSEGSGALNAEIYISIPRVSENAEKFEVSYQHELHRVIFHGALHLCGLRDKSKNDKEEMRATEDACLEAYFSNH